MGLRLGLGEVLELASSTAVVAGALQLTTRTAHARSREPDIVLERLSGTKICVDRNLFEDYEYKTYPLERKSWWSILSWTSVVVALTRVYMLPIQQLLSEYFQEMQRQEDAANQQGDQDWRPPPFPYERLKEFLHAGLPTAALETAKGLTLSLCKWYLDGRAVNMQNDRWAWALTKDVRKSIARKRQTLTWYQRGLTAPATYIRSQANVQFATFIVGYPFEVHRVIKQSRREGWDIQKTAGILARILLARIALQEIGLLAGCLGVAIGAAVWPRRATWFSTFLELPALFYMAGKVDHYFGIIMDPPPLGRDGNFHGGDDQAGNAPAQLTQDAFVPRQARAGQAGAPGNQADAAKQDAPAPAAAPAAAQAPDDDNHNDVDDDDDAKEAGEPAKADSAADGGTPGEEGQRKASRPADPAPEAQAA